VKSASGVNGRIWKAAALVAALGITALAAIGQNDWPAYGHGPGGAAFSPLNQINTKNVKDLRIAWVYNTGETAAFYEATPIVVDGRMYVSTPNENVVAISALTGKQIWKFDSHMDRAFHQRGVSYWPGDAQHGPRVIAALTNGNLYALDAKTGKLIPTFGNKGVVDLKPRKVLRMGHPATLAHST
jgi:glucose dehydrogenase